MRRIGPGLGFSRRRAAVAASYTAEATAYFAAMSVQPNSTRKTALNTLIASLKSSGVWAKLDWLSVHAAHDEQAARVNAVNPAQVASVGVAPTFTTDRGYTGNGTTQYINTGWNPSTAGGKFTQNDCSMGVWSGTEVSGSVYDLGNSYATICARSGTSSSMTAQSASGSTITLPIATSIGFTSWSRTSSTAGVAYKNGAALGTAISSTSTALRNASFLICAANSSSTGTVTPSLYSTRRNQAVCWGSQLSDAEQLALYNALATYMTAVGA